MSDLRQVLRRMSERFSWLADHHVTSEFAKIECQKLADECWQAQAAADQPDAGPRVKRAYPEASTFLVTGKGRNCPVCQRARQRMRKGWPEDLAYSAPPLRKGYKISVDCTPDY